MTTLPAANALGLVAILFVQMVYVAMVYGPIAAFLVELFPTRIRYTSMSLPYHIGNGVFGGLVPFVVTWVSGWMVENDLGGEYGKYAGLVYPIVVALTTVVVGLVWVRERRGVVLSGE